MSIKKVLSPRIDGHHGYLLVTTLKLWPGVHELLSTGSVEEWRFGIIGINEAREIRGRGGRAADPEHKRFTLIWFESIMPEAQNVLLKILEEPPLGTVFILGTAQAGLLLPTLLSRLEKITLPEQNNLDEGENKSEIENFIKDSPEQRLKYLEQLLNENEDNHKSAALDFLNNLERALAQKFKAEEMSGELIFALSEIRSGREHLSHPSGASRLVLQHIALILPPIDK